MGAAGRIGDSISCGDHVASGSPNVFVNGMPLANSGVPTTTGHGCFPPSSLTDAFSRTVFVNGSTIAIANLTRILPHRCGDNVHDGILNSGSPSVFIE